MLMDITFVGVGEAFDEKEQNTAILVEHEGKRLLCDCGYSVPQAVWKINPDQNFLWGVYLSHYHPDHAFGVVPLLMRMWQEGRVKALHIVGQEDTQRFVTELLEMAEPGFMNKLSFKLEFSSIQYLPSSIVPFTFTGAKTTHGRRNYALRIDTGKRICFMGDGNFTHEIIALADRAELLTINCNFETTENTFHANLQDVLKLLPRLNAKRIALLHINRKLRQKFLDMQFADPRIFVPRAGDVLSV